MATIDIRYNHKTNLDDARARTRKLLTAFGEEKRELVKSIEWLDASRAVAHGRGFEGRFEVTEQQLVIAIDMNLLTRPFKAKVETRLMERIEAEFGAGAA
jgi:hypothetical protein